MSGRRIAHRLPARCVSVTDDKTRAHIQRPLLAVAGGHLLRDWRMDGLDRNRQVNRPCVPVLPEHRAEEMILTSLLPCVMQDI